MSASPPDFGRLAAALRAHDAVVAAWLDGYAASPVRVPRPIDRGALGQMVAPIVEALGDALMPSPRPGGPPGSPTSPPARPICARSRRRPGWSALAWPPTRPPASTSPR